MARELPDTILVADIVRPHGVRGELVAEPHSDHPQRFARGAELLLKQGEAVRAVTVAASRRHRGRLLLQLDGVADRDAAETLRGAQLEIEREQVPPAPEGEHYFFELVGCACRDEQLGALGIIVDVLEDGGGLLLEVERGHEAEGEPRLLIPYVHAYVLRVDTEAGLVETRLPEGLIEACASTS